MAYELIVAGTTATAAQMNSALGNNGYTAFTPTVANITIGTGGSAQARYIQHGKTIHVEYFITFGTVASISGPPVINVPTGKNFVTATYFEAMGAFYNGATYPFIFTSNGGTQFAGYAIATSGAIATWTNPSGLVTVSNGSTLIFRATYETA